MVGALALPTVNAWAVTGLATSGDPMQESSTSELVTLGQQGWAFARASMRGNLILGWQPCFVAVLLPCCLMHGIYTLMRWLYAKDLNLLGHHLLYGRINSKKSQKQKNKYLVDPFQALRRP